MDLLMMGAIALGSLLVGLFFFKFWHQTRDRFFLYFAWSFWLEAANRVVIALLEGSEREPAIYVVRLIAYGLILLAIWDKNRSKRGR